MKQLLPNQTLFSDKIYIKMEQGETTFFICGNSGCGKTVSLQSISKNFEDSGYLPIFLKEILYYQAAIIFRFIMHYPIYYQAVRYMEIIKCLLIV